MVKEHRECLHRSPLVRAEAIQANECVDINSSGCPSNKAYDRLNG